jgi:hypothetical protein
MATNHRPHSLRLTEFSDRELMNIVLDNEDETGWVDSEQIALAINPDHVHARQCVGIRFSWMRRYGAMERQDDKTKEHYGRWKLTPVGRKIALGELSPEEKKLLDSLPPEKLMTTVGQLTRRYHRVNETAATMMRRAWINGTAPR